MGKEGGGRKRRWASRAGMVLAAVLALLVVAFFFMIRTRPGQRLVLREVVERLDAGLNGSLTVDDIRSRDLREGGILYGIRLEGPDGEPFLAADSASITYAWRTFLGDDIELRDVVLFSPVVFITKESEDEPFNAQVIFAGDEDEDAPGEGTGPDIVLRDVVVRDGTVRVLFPADPGAERAVVVSSPGGGPDLQRYAFDRVNGVFPLVRIAGDEDGGVMVEVASLDLEGQVYPEPFRIRDFEGAVRWARDLVTVQADRLVLGESEASGTAVVDLGVEEGLALELEAITSGFDLADLQWLEPRLPEGTADGELALELSPGRMTWDFQGLHVASGGSDLRAEGVARLVDDETSFEGLELDLRPLHVDRMRPWIEAEIPFGGTVEGNVTLDGGLDRLLARGRLTFRDPARGLAPTTADFGGLFHLAAGDFGVTDLEAILDPVDYRLLAGLVPDLSFGGTGRAELEATGNLRNGLRFVLDVTHREPGQPTSRILADGTIRESGSDYLVDVTSDVGPLSFTALRRYFPRLPVTGEVRGMIRARGPLSDLEVTTDLETEAGQLDLESRFDVRDPGAFYQVEGSVSRFRLSAVLPALPDPTILTGDVFVRGSGLDPATADATVRIQARDSRVGELFIDTTALDVRARGGVLEVDTLAGVFGGVEIWGGGTLALSGDVPAGEIRLAFETDSVGKLRPLLLGGDVTVQDTLRPLDREILVLDGVDPDTLPLEEDVIMSGAASGEAVLRGSLESFSAEGELSFEEARYGPHFIRNGRLVFSATDLPSLEGDIHAELEADSLAVFDRSFSSLEVDVDYARPQGSLELFLVRHEAEDYLARARFEVDTAGGRVELEELLLRFDTLRWELQDRAVVSWEGTGITVENLNLLRPGPDPMRITADGRLPTEGPADFDLLIENARLDRLTQLLQMEDQGLEGVLTARLSVRGSAAAPELDGQVEVSAFSYETFDLSRIEGEIDYASRSLRLDLEAWDGDLRVLQALGTVPVDLSLTGVEERLLDREMDVQVVADALPADYVLGFLDAMEDVEGTVDGDFRIRGTVTDPEPGGTLALQDAAWTLSALGVRYEDVEGVLEVQPDGTVEVEATARADGTARVTGTVLLEPLTNPTFDLLIALDDFRAVQRRDLEGNVSGEVTLTNTFRQPLVQGLASAGRGLEVEEGVLYLDEFVRGASVVDLSDPRFLDIDTTFVRERPVIGESQNPFLQNLRVNVDMAVEGNTWLRNNDMNVEIGGDLVVTYSRLENEIVLVGDLEAIRGEYTVLGRRFQVESGQVEFVGIPGINPNLNIRATTEVRRAEEPLVVAATVTGTLEDIRVELSSPTETVAHSDLVSYLVFGRPSYALGSGQRQFVEGAAGDFLSAGLSAVGGTLTSQLGTLVARQTGLDYLAISQPADLLGSSLGASFAQTTIEAGFYLEEDVFAVLMLRPLSSLGTSGTIFGGARLEWEATNDYTVELFLEDRFLRSRAFGFQELGSITTSLVKGFFVFREWGY